MAVYFVLFTLLGLAVASFLNVCMDRLPPQEEGGKSQTERSKGAGSLLWPPSHCPACRRRLAVRDLVPVVSFLWLRGRCRFCRISIPRRVLSVEIAVGALLPLLYWRYGLTVEFGVIALYCCLFILLLVIDLERGLILNKIVYPAMGVALLISGLLSSWQPAPGFISSLVGGAAGLGAFVLIAVVSRGGMGWGDVKVAALMGLAIGFPRVFLAFLIAVIGGGLVAIALLLLKLKKRKEGIPFGPFLSLGAMVTLLWASELLTWYRGLFEF